MKKKLFFSVIIITGMIAAINANVLKYKTGDISLNNIEALSSNENDTGTNRGFASAINSHVMIVFINGFVHPHPIMKLL